MREAEFRKVLVTGGSGFIGRRLVAALRARGTEVLAPTRAEWDVTEPAPEIAGIDHVFHLAGLSGVLDSWREPNRFQRVNVQGTVEVLELCRRAHCSMTLVSGYCYGIPERLPIGEDHPLRPNNPYAFTKLQAEAACRFFHERFDVPLVVLRPFNVYGPGQSRSFLIPHIIAQALAPECAAIEVSDLAPRRDFVHVDDLVMALLCTAGAASGETLNVAGGRSWSVEEIVNAVRKVARSAKPYRSAGRVRAHEIPDTVGDVSAIRARYGWAPRIGLEEGLAGIVVEDFRQ